jgi:phage baseplate assembly protein W
MTIQGSCLSYPFRADQRGMLATTANRSEMIAQSIASIIETRRGERVMCPDYGIADYVFSVIDSGFTARLGYQLTQQINRYEPLVDRVQVKMGSLNDSETFVPGFTEDQQRAAVQIEFTERGSNTPHNLVFPTWTLRA